MPSAPPQPRLLVSVRNRADARAALQGGADLIDIKEPARGALGMADNETIASITDAVNGSAPVSAALGELHEQHAHTNAALRYVKLGLGNAPHDWRHRLAERAETYGRHRFIAVAYADHARVDAPSVQQVLEWAIAHRAAGLLIDSAVKDGRGLFDWCQQTQLAHVAKTTQRHGLMLALAGSLDEPGAARAAVCGADIIAVRGAACANNLRTAMIDAGRVRSLKHLLAADTSASPQPAG